KNRRFQDVNPGEHQRGLGIGDWGLGVGESPKISDAVICCNLYLAEPFALRVGTQYECGKGILFTVRLDRCAEINVSNDLSIDDDKGLSLELIAHLIQCAGRTENLIPLDRIV